MTTPEASLAAGPPQARGLARWIPALGWLRRYQPSWLRADLQSAPTLATRAHELAASGIKLRAVEARSSLRDRLRREGIAAKLGGLNRWATVADAVDAFQSGESRDPNPPPEPVP